MDSFWISAIWPSCEEEHELLPLSLPQGMLVLAEQLLPMAGWTPARRSCPFHLASGLFYLIFFSLDGPDSLVH